MGRPLNKIANFVTIDVAKARQISVCMPDDSQFGSWARKAIDDLSTGCIRADVDPDVKEAYTQSYCNMVKAQERKKANYEKKKKAAEEKGKALADPNALVFGRFENVVLTQDQFNDLAVRIGNVNESKMMIDNLSCKLEDGTSTSTNHYATLCYWIDYRKEHPEKKSFAELAETEQERRRNAFKTMEAL